MRKEYVETNNGKIAIKICPWACKVVRVCDGFMCFESLEDYRIWEDQK